ncbi:MAG TPA: hypothetical protein PLS66_01195 [Tepiditoga sp.]|nr:hypothetical protein [Tepiditoga sp.]
MFDPIRALLASSCSRKGISDAETDAICLGVTAIYSTSSFGTKVTLPRYLTSTYSDIILFS